MLTRNRIASAQRENRKKSVKNGRAGVPCERLLPALSFSRHCLLTCRPFRDLLRLAGRSSFSLFSFLFLMQTLFFRCCYSTSSKGWIQRQARDPYVKAAKANQYRARSAFKLLQLDSKYKLLKKGHVVIDCGAAPGGWTQVIARKVRDTGLVVAVDLLPIDPIPNAHIIKGDFMDAKVQSKIQTTLQQRPVNLVCSDMAPSFTGNHFADHARSMVRRKTKP